MRGARRAWPYATTGENVNGALSSLLCCLVHLRSDDPAQPLIVRQTHDCRATQGPDATHASPPHNLRWLDTALALPRQRRPKVSSREKPSLRPTGQPQVRPASSEQSGLPQTPPSQCLHQAGGAARELRPARWSGYRAIASKPVNLPVLAPPALTQSPQPVGIGAPHGSP
jgi:hypothetical protein